MTTPPLAGMLLTGAIQGLVLAALAAGLRRHTKVVLYIVLVFAALMYLVFAYAAVESPAWFALEAAGVLLYGAVGARGLRGSGYWLAAGWALHPVWDVALHYAGPGHFFAPVTYTIPCLSFDLVVAAAIVVLEWRKESAARTAMISAPAH